MGNRKPPQITILLDAYRDGDQEAFNELARLIYPELKAIARRQSRNSGLSATTVVSETFLRLLSGGDIGSEDRQQFFALAATIMRRIIVDEVRYATASKRHAPQATFEESQVADETQASAELLLAVDGALDILARDDQRLAQVFECRYFAGLSTAETAEAVSLSERSVERLWSSARSRIADLITASS